MIVPKSTKEKVTQLHISMIEKLKIITQEEQEILNGRKEIDKTLYTEEPGLVIDGKKLLMAGKLIQVRPHTRFIHFPKHRHNYIEVIYMCLGETTHMINDEEILLKQGELLFLSQGAIQEIMPAKEEDIAVNFIILPEFFDVVFGMLGEDENLLRDFLIGCLRKDFGYTSYLHFQVSEVLPVQNLVENVVWTLINGQSNKRNINQMTMALLLLQLTNCTDTLKSGNKQSEQGIVFQVLRYVEEHYKEASLEELAQELNYSIFWIGRVIKKYTGKNFMELLQTKRLNQAVFLLTQTKLPIADIILAVGYDNTSYFHRIFKKRYGLTPKQYRIQNKSSSFRK